MPRNSQHIHHKNKRVPSLAHAAVRPVSGSAVERHVAHIDEAKIRFAKAAARHGLHPDDCLTLAGIEVPEGRDRDDLALDLASDPEVIAVIAAEQHRMIRNELTFKALRCLGAILDDPDAPAPAQVSAARLVLEAGGVLARSSASAALAADSEPEKLTPGELNKQLVETRTQISALRSMLGAGNTTGYHPDPPSGSAQVIDL